MTTTKATSRLRKTFAVLAVAGAIGLPAAFSATPASAAAADSVKGFENMPPA